MIRNSLIILIAIGIAVTSRGEKKLSKTNLSSIYSEHNFSSIEYMVYHTSDQKSTIYINVKLNDLLYAGKDTNNLTARFKISHSLYDSYESKLPLDTASLVFSDNQFAGQEMEMIVDFDVNVSFPGDYILKAEVIDLNLPENQIITFIPIYKTFKNSSQNFMVTDANDYPVFGNSLQESQQFKVLFNDPDSMDLFVRYYDQTFPLAKPPFAMNREEPYKFQPDSIFSVRLLEGSSELLELPFHGIYHFQTELEKPEGLTLFRFDDGFPEVSSPAQAIVPLRYLTTQKEFDQLLNYKDFKVAVDSFWLERSSHQPQRARNMIKRYYSRVQDANRLFSSYHEGWKTDRGIIYIIYGPPSEIYREENEEEWVYGERGNPMSIKFFFNQVENPFTYNDYSLQRASVYKTSWYIAIENWRR